MAFSTKAGAARLMLYVVISLILLKAVVSWITGSMSIIAQAADSLLDIFAGIVTISTIRIANRPADREHPYGHGKVEDIGGVVQGVLIFIAGGTIIYSSVRRIIEGAAIEEAEAGIAVMLISIVASIFLSRHLRRVAKATDSTVLEANAQNIAGDVYSASAVLIGLLAFRLTNIVYIDSIIAIGMALYLFWIGYRAISRPFAELVDRRLSHDEEVIIEACIEGHGEQLAGFHKLRTRHSGSQHYIDLHLVINREVSLEDAHAVCDQIEKEIKDYLHDVSVTIHVEPCNGRCKECLAICSKLQND